MVVARERQHAAMLQGPGGVGMLEGIAGTVDARSLAIPDAEDAVVLGVPVKPGLLRAPNGSRRQILVHVGTEKHLMLFQVLGGAAELLIVAAKGRAAVASDEACRVETCRLIPPMLLHRQAHERLGSGHEHV